MLYHVKLSLIMYCNVLVKYISLISGLRGLMHSHVQESQSVIAMWRSSNKQLGTNHIIPYIHTNGIQKYVPVVNIIICLTYKHTYIWIYIWSFLFIITKNRIIIPQVCHTFGPQKSQGPAATSHCPTPALRRAPPPLDLQVPYFATRPGEMAKSRKNAREMFYSPIKKRGYMGVS